MSKNKQRARAVMARVDDDLYVTFSAICRARGDKVSVILQMPIQTAMMDYVNLHREHMQDRLNNVNPKP